MRKWKCENKECRASCVIYTENCAPQRCVNIVIDGLSAWQEVEEETTTKNNQFKVPEWIYDTVKRKYVHVEKAEDYDWWVDNIACGRIKQARKRPFNEKEMQNLVGKMYESSCCTFLITGYSRQKKSIKVNELWFDSEELMNGKNSIYPPLIDNKPCYVLEHKTENGEWVE